MLGNRILGYVVTCHTKPAMKHPVIVMPAKPISFKKKLGGEPGAYSFIPDRPKGMHHKTYNRIVNEIYRLEGLGEQGMMDKWGMAF